MIALRVEDRDRILAEINAWAQSEQAGTGLNRNEIATTRDSKLYMQGFEDGQAMGRVSAELQAKAERAALAAHWEDGNANS